ncbi:MAG TPA: radical SAM protein [Polyangiales bacterium]|nr:radical SAM protein [Polyangiales bacterium]
MRRLDRPRVLLLWPGGLFERSGGFGVAQLLHLAAAARGACDAEVDVVDLDMEGALGGFDLAAQCRPGYDLVGISCYSSYDLLRAHALAARVRELLPDAWIVAGGYHVSARPIDLLAEGSAFDYAVVGDGEQPLCRLLRALAAGRKPLQRVCGPESYPDLSQLRGYDWSLLERYFPVLRQSASEVQLYLSRGCPYDCSFCMERAKRDTSWRAIEADAAIAELHRVDRIIDLRGMTLRILDPLFGMKSEWRKRVLTGLAQQPLRAEKTWLVMRADLIDREDMELMARANIACGFGLESGDPGQLRRIRKSGKLDSFLDKMLQIAEWARELNVPFGANIIVGHPGETEASMRTSARYMERLFLDPRGTHGFLAVDPFRLYPGSPIDEHLEQWKADTGMRVHRYPWWFDGDQAFLSEWIDPSDSLDYVRTKALYYELFEPIVRAIPERFAYTGRGREYMLRAPLGELDVFSSQRKRELQRQHEFWSGVERLGLPAPVAFSP